MYNETIEMDGSSPDVLRAFYQHLFPFKQVFEWLNHDGENAPHKLWTHREFAFTLAGDVYIRYNSFDNWSDLKTSCLRLTPGRFEIGPQYSHRPRNRKTLRPGALVPERRELVFDIDMTDYDEIRTCCKGKGICKRCWGFIAAATKVLDHALRDQFGYSHLLWVYSGRRGIHCWVSDPAALDLKDEERRALVGYLEVIQGTVGAGGKRIKVRYDMKNELSPSLKESYDIVKNLFTDLILNDQECFQSPEQYETLVNLLPDADLRATLLKSFSSNPGATSRSRWQTVLTEINKRSSKPNHKELMNSLEDIIIQYLYPRMDQEVSKKRNHLLKSPFCVHPGTNRICVPVDPKNVSAFDPGAVPTIGQLLTEINSVKATTMEVDGETKPMEHWQQTSLAPYIHILEKHNESLKALTHERIAKEREEKRIGGMKREAEDFMSI